MANYSLSEEILEFENFVLSKEIVDYPEDGTITYSYTFTEKTPIWIKNRIVNAYKLLSDNGMGPRLMSSVVKGDKMEISVENLEELDIGKDINVLCEQISSLISRLHSLNLVHGNVRLRNILQRGDQLVLSSPEYLCDILNLGGMKNNPIGRLGPTGRGSYNEEIMSAIHNTFDTDLLLNLDYRKWTGELEQLSRDLKTYKVEISTYGSVSVINFVE